MNDIQKQLVDIISDAPHKYGTPFSNRAVNELAQQINQLYRKQFKQWHKEHARAEFVEGFEEARKHYRERLVEAVINSDEQFQYGNAGAVIDVGVVEEIIRQELQSDDT